MTLSPYPWKHDAAIVKCTCGCISTHRWPIRKVDEICNAHKLDIGYNQCPSFMRKLLSFVDLNSHVYPIHSRWATIFVQVTLPPFTVFCI